MVFTARVFSAAFDLSSDRSARKYRRRIVFPARQKDGKIRA